MEDDGHGEEKIELEEGRATGPRWAQLEEEVGVFVGRERKSSSKYNSRGEM